MYKTDIQIFSCKHFNLCGLLVDVPYTLVLCVLEVEGWSCRDAMDLWGVSSEWGPWSLWKCL